VSTIRSIHATTGQKQVVTLPADASILAAARAMRDDRVGCLIVTGGDGNAVGIVTERDIAMRAVAEGLDPGTTPVSRIMTRNIFSCNLDTQVDKAQQAMVNHNIRHLPIVDHGRPVGMVSMRDILTHRLKTSEALVRHQADLLGTMEQTDPGISRVRRDASGRVVISERDCV
jgi:signal-transduction protein with cAMP-binding, CBS, and nucleotidyltransferase domain